MDEERMEASILLFMARSTTFNLNAIIQPLMNGSRQNGTDGISFVREPLTVASERLQINDVICLNFAKG